MKPILKISMVLLLVASTSVCLASEMVYKPGTTTDYVFIPGSVIFVDMETPADQLTFTPTVSVINFTGIMPEAILYHDSPGEYIGLIIPVYKNPDVDRSWVFKYEALKHC